MEEYEKHCTQSSDINEHLPNLRKLAKECSSVVEMGIRDVVSTWGLLQGLSESAQTPRSYLGVDLNYPPTNKAHLAQELANAHQISFQIWLGNNFYFEMPPTDLLFIDTFHTYRHLTFELETFSPQVRKYIAMHDTSAPWGERDEPGDQKLEYPAHIHLHKRGLWAAVEDFLQTHPEWRLKERYFNNAGFTVLERI